MIKIALVDTVKCQREKMYRNEFYTFTSSLTKKVYTGVSGDTLTVKSKFQLRIIKAFEKMLGKQLNNCELMILDNNRAYECDLIVSYHEMNSNIVKLYELII